MAKDRVGARLLDKDRHYNSLVVRRTSHDAE